MSLKKYLVLFLCLATQGFSTSFTFGESVDVESEKEYEELILENLEYFSSKVEGEKIYLLPEQIYPTKDGCFLRIDQFSLVKVPCLYSNEEGCYITLR